MSRQTHDAPRSVAGTGLALPVLVVGAMVTGFSPILVRLATDAGAGAEAVAFWRMTFALPLLAVWAAVERRVEADRIAAGQAQERPRPKIGLLLLAGAFFAADLATWHAGIVRTDVANATLLPNLTPILVGVAAWLIFGERMGGRFLLGAGAALFGALLLSGAGFQGLEAAEAGARSERALGDVLSALTAVWYAGYMLSVKAVRGGIGPGRLMFRVALVGVPVLFAATFVSGQSFTPPTLAAWGFMAALGAVVHVGGQGAIAFALGRLPAGQSALTILIQPLVAAIVGWMLFGEALGALQLGGGALVLAGVWLAARARKARSAPAA